MNMLSAKHLLKSILSNPGQGVLSLVDFNNLLVKAKSQRAEYRRMQLGANDVEVIARGIEENSELRCLQFSGTALSREAIERIATAIRAHGKITTLDFKHCDLYDPWLEHLAEAIVDCPQLERLTLDGNPCTAAGVAMITQAVAKLPKFNYLSLEHILLGSSGFQAINKLLQQSVSLQHLNLGHTVYFDNDYAPIAEIEDPESRAYYEDCVKDAVPHLLSGITASRLASLNLSACNIGDDNAIALAELLTEHTSMRALTLRANNFSAVAAKAFARLSLSQLDLSANDVCEAAAPLLASDTAVLRLSQARIKTSDILEASLGSRHISSLDLSYNQIDDAGASHLATVGSIGALDISGNRDLTDAGVTKLLQTKALEALGLTDTQVSAKAFIAMQAKSTLERLAIGQVVTTKTNDFAFDVLAENQHLKDLIICGFKGNAEALLALAGCRGLRSLALRGVEIEGDLSLLAKLGLQHLTMAFGRCSETPDWNSLVEAGLCALKLENNSVVGGVPLITDGQVAELVQYDALSCLYIDTSGLSEASRLRVSIRNAAGQLASSVSTTEFAARTICPQEWEYRLLDDDNAPSCTI
jgi:Ran GTPase-activating protein (RanGAP) involved in mRNA processing and transport